MTSSGLLVRLSAKPGKERDVEAFLRSALPLAAEEIGTTAWLAVRFGRGAYGIFEAFLDDTARQAHLEGPVVQALRDRADELFDELPRIKKLTVLAEKIPSNGSAPDSKGLLITFRAKSGQEPAVEQFLRDARSLVRSEPKTTAWFALRTDAGEFGILDVFPDNGGRLAHLIGQVPRELAKHSLTWLGSMPELEMLSVEAEKLGI
jgi:quinol monooxygenase YgiN